MVMEFAKTKRLLDPSSETDYLSIPGGIAVYGGSNSPYNQVIGFGASGTEVESLARANAFFWPKLSRFEVELSPWASSTAPQVLLEKKFRSGKKRSLWSRGIDGSVEDLRPPTLDAVVPGPLHQPKLWAMHLTQAYDTPGEWDPIDTFLTYGHMPSVHKYVVLHQGLVGGGAALFLRDQTALLFGAAVKLNLRGKKLHQTLIWSRLKEACRLGANLALAETVADPEVEHNLSSMGFIKVAELPNFSRPS